MLGALLCQGPLSHLPSEHSTSHQPCGWPWRRQTQPPRADRHHPHERNLCILVSVVVVGGGGGGVESPGCQSSPIHPGLLGQKLCPGRKHSR